MISREDYISGELLLIDKPLNWTSFQVVNKIRWLIKNKFSLKKIKVGHAGTLDPLATGLLIICTGKMTKEISSFQNQTKKYTGTFLVGVTTPSYDLETKQDNSYPINHITDDLIISATQYFIGKIKQKPPIFSAIKKNGKRLYESARIGEDIIIDEREVEILNFKIIKINIPNIDFEVECSKGTYIRSLANDFGKKLNSGATLAKLKRTKIGKYSLNESVSIEEFTKNLG
ncbi:tRNA pseudouridine(55) synthase TruB [Flavobacteriaceae bacterium]|nr:tRNA pseudouridine(55) synthase TruB [Flavobacteriaceae bacterium]MDC1492044.1 tRNA pseudouridine(55) synthase TruB [Flavobacteriaceae bacterium]MDC1535035.1 tRNA pseudouridine(55) synthase TruB [Flavobacteriaceae bacterium]